MKKFINSGKMQLDLWVQKNKLYLFLVIFTIALLFGLPYHDGRSTYVYAELTRDLNVLRWVNSGHMVFLGPNSSLGNFYFPPAYYYIIFPFALFFNFAPYSLATASLFFSLATLSLSFFVARKWWRSDFLAIVCMFFMGTSILTFQLTKYGSNPNFVPFFSLLFFYSLERLIAYPKSLKYLAFLSLAFAITTQLHAVPLVSLPLVLIFAVATRKIKVTVKTFSVFLAIVLLIYSPYLYYESRNDFSNTKALFQIASSQSNLTMVIAHYIDYFGFWFSSILSINTFFNIVGILGFKFYVSFFISMFIVWPIFKYNLAHRFYLLSFEDFSLPDSVMIIIRYWLIIPGVILLLPIGATNYFQIYYFFLFFPLLFFLQAWGFTVLLRKGMHILASYLLVLYLLLQILQMYYYHQMVITQIF